MKPNSGCFLLVIGIILVCSLYRESIGILAPWIKSSSSLYFVRDGTKQPPPNLPLFLPRNTSSKSSTSIADYQNDGETAAPAAVPDVENHREQLYISYQLHQDMPYKNPFIPIYNCPVNDANKTFYPLPAKFHEKGLLDFTTTISTNLHILTMGDSVGILFAQNLEGAAAAADHRRTVLRYTVPPLHEGMAIAAPVRGGGVLASWRITGWLLRQGEGKPLPNNHGGGWDREDVERLLNYTYHPDDDAAVVSVKSMDVLIFRIPTGWLAFGGAKVRKIQETVDLAHELFGVKVVVLVTAPFDNNVPAIERMNTFNKMVRGFCRSWKPPTDGSGGVQRVLCLDYNKFTHDLIETNAISLGMNVSKTDEAGSDDYMLQRLRPISKTDFPPSIAHLCAEFPSDPNRTACNQTVITIDGKHPCMETIGARVNAGVSCLLVCVFTPNKTVADNSSFVRGCEQDCNDKFMTLSPIDQSMFVA